MILFPPTFTTTALILLSVYSLVSVPAIAAPQFGRPYLHVLEQGQGQRFNGSEIQRPGNITVTSAILTTIGTEVITSTVVIPTASARTPVNVSGALPRLRTGAATGMALGTLVLVLFAL